MAASRVLMIRPAAFGFNSETADSNAFQAALSETGLHEAALREFDAFASQLRESGVEAVVVNDTPEPQKPDAAFPNNWVSFHNGGRAVLYSMASPARQHEVRPDVISDLGYEIALDFRAYDGYLEGTGSLVIDHLNRTAYACPSPRTDPRLVHAFCKEMGYEPFVFDAAFRGKPIYHTNVLLAIGERLAVVCLECCTKPELVRRSLEERGEVLEISSDQMANFAGNLLQLHSITGSSVWVLSKRAWQALTPEQQLRLSADGKLVIPDLHHIETASGGSARCMLAELF